MEDNGFEPFAPGCKPGVLAKYTNPPNSFLVEMIGIEPIVTEVGRFTVSCHTITAASPLYWSEYKDSNLGPPGPKPGALARLRYTPNYIGSSDWDRTNDRTVNSRLLCL